MPLLDVDPLDFLPSTLVGMTAGQQMEVISWMEHHLDMAEARYQALLELSAAITGVTENQAYV